MKLRINGEEREVPELSSVADLIEHLALPPAALLVEQNDTALRREEWASAALQEGDRLELLRIAAGG